ncbi:hypothetical protein PC129_g17933 [Phytophthora cactorum]|uniref:Uncharacterized protein n=1 Tax=Phytophthora cactorum TaxID=29920 RepID=A0A8T1BK12_9STRA|nr:hypothetical protein Pcac1_g17790 [Phytophthora cactorum]KAG2893975.1 hypothetical protein PC114_g16065 [Phytophthora cactorum]KAG2905267.1 hypothetical protein PC117_g20788 [Phytophthora cactorum]KAG2979541.1 hypothetical protein PC119_g21459 [Phytophthora cactorum]KAG3001897.1 hypothetical protein PC120_g20002 [Phytophthora cactorum]
MPHRHRKVKRTLDDAFSSTDQASDETRSQLVDRHQRTNGIAARSNRPSRSSSRRKADVALKEKARLLTKKMTLSNTTWKRF